MNIMIRPAEPKKEDCCNSGCNPCIFDIYEKQLKIYESYLKSGEKPIAIKENAISQLEYSKFQVMKTIEICKEHKLILFKNKRSGSHKVFWNPGEHFLLKYIESTEQSRTRAYTPIKLHNVQLEDNHDFAIIVKRYNNALVSNYLYNLNVGDTTMWRGPYGHFQLNFNKCKRIIMISQGTAIAPFYSIIQHILDDEDNMTKLILFYCCKSIETVLLREELYSFRLYWNFTYSIHIGESAYCDKILYKYQEPILKQRLSSKIILNNCTPLADGDYFLISGSSEFMNYFKKCLEQENIQNNVILF